MLDVELFVGSVRHWRWQVLLWSLWFSLALLVLRGIVGVHLLLESSGGSHWFTHFDLLPLPARSPLLVRDWDLQVGRGGGAGGRLFDGNFELAASFLDQLLVLWLGGKTSDTDPVSFGDIQVL